MREVYQTLIKDCPSVANKMHFHAEMLERTLGQFEPNHNLSEYVIDGETKRVKAHMIQDNATLFLNVWEMYDNY